MLPGRRVKALPPPRADAAWGADHSERGVRTSPEWTRCRRYLGSGVLVVALTLVVVLIGASRSRLSLVVAPPARFCGSAWVRRTQIHRPWTSDPGGTGRGHASVLRCVPVGGPGGVATAIAGADMKFFCLHGLEVTPAPLGTSDRGLPAQFGL